MQETVKMQEKIIQELNEKVAVLTVAVAQAPPRLVGVLVADQNGAPHLVQGVSIVNPNAPQLS